MMTISRKTGVALVVLSLLGTASCSNLSPQRASVGPSAEKRAVDRVDQTVYRPMGTNAGTPERAAEDAFYNRQFGGVSPP